MRWLTNIIISTALLAGFMGSVQATTYTNLPSTSVFTGFGAPYGGAVGQTLKGVSGVLQDFTFYAAGGGAGDVVLMIAEWQQSKAVGPALYTSAPIAFGGGQQALTASGINVSLLADHTYVAYLHVGGLDNPAGVISMALTYANDGGLGGNAYYRESGGDPLETPAYSWNTLDEFSFSYTANIAAVPEPETYAMLLAGLGVVGFATRRKRNASRGR
jgi:hypothetical protein